jgi:SNF2 family DNA or RNA helicase
MKFTPHPYQAHAIQHILDQPASALFLDLGLGKTVSTLTAVDTLINDAFEVDRVLVIAPKMVAENTWSREAAKWDHLRHLTISKVLGDEKQRKAALKAKADIYVINRENVPWLVAQYGTAWPFDMVVIDELSSFKSSKAQRFKALRKVRPLMRRVVGLTGTPAPNGLLDLWSQLYLLDRGQRLGETVTGFRSRYFREGRRINGIVTDYKPRDEAQQNIHTLIEDICISMKASDYLALPERVDTAIEVTLPDKVLQLYRDFEVEQVMQLMEGEDITAVNAAALTGKLLQFANGAVYNEDREVRIVHDRKLDALEELVEAANGKPVLVFYSYLHDLDRITQRLKAYKPVQMKGKVQEDAWNAGQIPVMLAHPASAGHGLNLQDGGNTIIWYGLPWSLELYQQAVGRLHRQGQTQIVTNYRITVPGTVEDDVIAALDRKAKGQDELLEALKARVAEIKKRMRK